MGQNPAEDLFLVASPWGQYWGGKDVESFLPYTLIPCDFSHGVWPEVCTDDVLMGN